MAKRLYTCRATRSQPALVVTKEWQLWVMWDDPASEHFDMKTGELCGFNVGEFSSVLTGGPVPSNDDCLPFTLKSDTDLVVLAVDSVKTLMPVATAAFHAMNKNNIPDVGFQFHQLTPLTFMVEACVLPCHDTLRQQLLLMRCLAQRVACFCQRQGTTKPAFCRFNVLATLGVTAKYCPARLSDANAAEMQQKRAVLGATFLGRLTSLYQPESDVSVKVVWEIDLCAEPPAMYRPVKPKLYFIGAITLTKGRYYRLL